MFMHPALIFKIENGDKSLWKKKASCYGNILALNNISTCKVKRSYSMWNVTKWSLIYGLNCIF
jgi:hypothetical protein